MYDFIHSYLNVYLFEGNRYVLRQNYRRSHIKLGFDYFGVTGKRVKARDSRDPYGGLGGRFNTYAGHSTYLGNIHYRKNQGGPKIRVGDAISQAAYSFGVLGNEMCNKIQNPRSMV